ncbi:MAG: DUF4255 domain-containing protein [Candidatus Thiodiazotropha sp. (ex Dulcina madagascariensis)]|nr:DUF4255 domain-containing protein [Candidatus Thiodiazotropha sp. (ex Epidulcina cf. delphinae)]MCU7922521.1 DUF4255 domain-containing protein [Candidatus Thiodiazotropha sp. (ex Dulcina madagascariensis)]MCU7925853.1 DUF4255 domain-containing protein [Candidatus Thiodiazotropha sp. (ex Dulcina madagascariensis)]MCU7934032.1 DUF4255 domain-containing protein [Candidatus Thiodiazotropha sp. (ex Dulcina madagascariensis)]
MADYSVIADVSETLQTVLTNALSTLAPGPPVAELHDLSGPVATNPPRVTLFLYEVMEDHTVRNRPATRSITPPTLTEEKPPLPLLLRYLLTPWSGDILTDHRMLGRALQVLYDGAILSGPQLSGGLAGTSDALKLKLAPLTLEDRSRVFAAAQERYHLSVTYEVRVVNLDPINQQQLVPVQERQLIGARPVNGS